MASYSQTIRNARHLAEQYALGAEVDASGLRAIHKGMEDQAAEIMELRDRIAARCGDAAARDLARELSIENENLRRPK